MLRKATVAVCLLYAANSGALAQPAPPAGAAPAANGSEASMDPPMPGDHWTYQIKDEITGELKRTNTLTVTDVTPTEVAVRVETLGSGTFGEYIYDHSWNLINSPLWKYSPNDGAGVKLPLAVGSSWKFQDSQINTQHGASFKSSGSSKVVAQESITTGAGTFDTFKIETTVTVRNANDPTKKGETLVTAWYAPAANHVVKTVSKVSANGHVDQDISTELVDYGRR